MEAKETNHIQKKGWLSVVNTDDTSSKRRNKKYLLDFALETSSVM